MKLISCLLFSILIFSFIPGDVSADGQFDGFWKGTINGQETFSTIIFQETDDLMYFYDQDSGAIRLSRIGSQWKTTSPVTLEVYGMVLVVSEIVITFQSSTYFTGTMKALIDNANTTLNLNGTIQNCTTLTSNSEISGLSGVMDSENYYQFTVNPGSKQLQLQTQGGTGDCDLILIYHRPIDGTWSPIVSDEFGNNESVTILTPNEGKWYTILYAYSNYSQLTLRLSADTAKKSFPVGVLHLLLFD